MTRRRSSKIPRNPLAWPLVVGGLAFFLLGGVVALLDPDGQLNGVFFTLLLGVLILLLAYTVMAIRIGWIASVGHLGRLHYFERSRDRVLFWFTAVLYLAVSLPSAWYLSDRILRSSL